LRLAGRGVRARTRLLIVLPGGEGSADFNPFIRWIYHNVLNERRQ
jgi:hypothetical protein